LTATRSAVRRTSWSSTAAREPRGPETVGPRSSGLIFRPTRRNDDDVALRAGSCQPAGEAGVPGDGRSPPQRIHEPGLAGLSSHEVDDEAPNPTRGGRLSPERRQPLRFFKASKVRTVGRLADPRPGEQRSPSRDGAVQLRTGLEPADEVEPDPSGEGEASPGCGGRANPSGRARSRESCAQPSGDGACPDPRVWAGSRTRGLRGSLEGRNPGEQRLARRGDSARHERTHGGTKASRWTKPAGSGGHAARGPGRPGSGSRLVEREPQARGDPGDCASCVGVGETRGQGRGRRARERRWMTAREHVAPRGVRDLREGKALKGGVQERLRHGTGPWNSSLLGNR
jgi:hypothetical protein